MAESVTVDVKSAWLSKINWTQAIGVVASVAAVFGFDMPPAMQLQVVAAIQGIVAVVTWALKTFATTTVTPSSTSKA
jgi:hypothetical protein